MTTGAVNQLAVDSQPSSAVSQMTLETTSPAPLTHLTADGSSTAGMTHLRIEGPAMGVDSQAAMAVQSLLDSQQAQDPPGSYYEEISKKYYILQKMAHFAWCLSVYSLKWWCTV